MDYKTTVLAMLKALKADIAKSKASVNPFTNGAFDHASIAAQGNMMAAEMGVTSLIALVESGSLVPTDPNAKGETE